MGLCVPKKPTNFIYSRLARLTTKHFDGRVAMDGTLRAQETALEKRRRLNLERERKKKKKKKERVSAIHCQL